ncbi:MAG TPA: DoxX family protein [Acidobacteriaceae bacterium]|nr:DoxX family protein [Acidobacteriaceae bacterium]
MSTTAQVVAVSKGAVWTGRVISTLVVLFLLMDGVMKVMVPAAVVKGFAQSGWPIHFAVPLGIIVLACTVLYAIPQTSIFGAILLTGWLGGAVATMMRMGNPWYFVLLPVIFGVLAWLGLFLREQRLRALLPLKS